MRQPEPEREEAANLRELIQDLLVHSGRSSAYCITDVRATTRPTIPEIARALSATAIIECSVRYAGDDLLVTAQLIDPETDSHLWSETYPGTLSDLGGIFAMQADIAMNIANALAAEFSPAEQARLETAPTKSPEAYALYLAARGPVGDPERRLELLEQAVAVDPEFALAHALIAGALAQTTVNSIAASASRTWKDVEARARQSAKRALAIDPNADPAYWALAILDELSWQWADAQRNYQRAYELNPNRPDVLWRYAWFNSWIGNHAEAVRIAERAVELAPTEIGPLAPLAVVRAHAGDLQGALAACRRALEIVPNHMFCTHGMAMTSMLLEDPVAVSHARQVERLLGSNRLLAVIPQLAVVYDRFGYREDVARIVAEVEAAGRDRDIGAGTYAVTYLAAGEREKVREWLEVAVGKVERNEPDAGNADLFNMRNNIYGHPLLEEPEFRALRARLGRL